MTTPTCTARVPDGGRSVSFHSCRNAAKEGTDPPRCGVHLPKAKADPRPALTPAAVQVTERVLVGLSWPEGQGPRWRPRYSERVIEFGSLTVTVGRGDHPDQGTVSGQGRQVKKDGTIGQARPSFPFLTWESLPVEVREAFLDAFDELEGQER